MINEMRNRILFQKLDEDTEEWNDYYTCFSKVNNSGGNEFFSSRTEQSTNSVIFTVWYCAKLKDLYLKTQLYRIKFDGAIFDIQDVDNYMFKNETLKIKAVGKSDRSHVVL